MIFNEINQTNCPHCNSTNISRNISVSQSVETGHVGLEYKDGRLFLGNEPLRADLCLDCGSITRLYINNSDHKWITIKK